MTARFTKHVTFEDESWDFGNNVGTSVTVGDPPLIRFAATRSTRVVVSPAVVETRRTYLTSLDHVPAVADEESDFSLPTLRRDELGRLYFEEPAVSVPAVTRKMTPEEDALARSAAIKLLNEKLEATYQAGLLLAEGRIEE